MKDSEDRYPVNEARRAFSDLVNRVHYTGEPVGITKRGRLVARLVSASTEPGDVLEAFRAATDWTDEEALHYASCQRCIPICGHEEDDCPASPRRKRVAEALARRNDTTAQPKKSEQ